jgi:hypothetical protein
MLLDHTLLSFMKKILSLLLITLLGSTSALLAAPTFTAPPLAFPSGVTLKNATDAQITQAVSLAIKSDPSHAKEIGVAAILAMKNAGRKSQADMNALVAGILASTSKAEAATIIAAMAEAAPTLAPLILNAAYSLAPDLITAINKALVATGGSGLQNTTTSSAINSSSSSAILDGANPQNQQPTPTPTPNPTPTATPQPLKRSLPISTPTPTPEPVSPSA